MSRVSGFGTRRRLLALLSIAAAAAIVVAVTTGDSPRDKLAQWVNPRGDCASVENDSPPLTSIHDVPIGFLRASVEYAVIVCNMLGPNTVYVRFDDHATMVKSLMRFPTVAKDHPCLLGSALFTTDGLDTGTPQTFCAQLHGTILTSA